MKIDKIVALSDDEREVNGDLEQSATAAQFAPQLNIVPFDFGTGPLSAVFKSAMEAIIAVLERSYAECSASADPLRALFESQEQLGEEIVAAFMDTVDAFLNEQRPMPEELP